MAEVPLATSTLMATVRVQAMCYEGQNKMLEKTWAPNDHQYTLPALKLQTSYIYEKNKTFYV